ncbi:MAG TPA: DUF2127 domain-containing protein [Candidatus Binatia bacterium]
MNSGTKESAHRIDTGIWLIAVFKLAKALALIAAGIGAALLLHHDVQATLRRLTGALLVGRESRVIEQLLAKAASIDDRELKLAEAGTFLYAALFLTEGTGLLLRQHWAEYLTTIITASFIPFEIIAVIRRFGPVRVVVVLINIAVVWYLVRKVQRDRKAA